MNTRILVVLSLAAALAAGSAGCSVGAGGSGTFSLLLADATTDAYNAVYVTIREVDVATDDDAWSVVSTPNRTYNLLALVNGVREQLALTDLPPGHYTQMRLIIGDLPDAGVNILSQAHPYANYVIDSEDAYHALKIPSGLQTGIKIVYGFDINANSTTELILDFDASKSVVVAGSSGLYLLEPTIQVLSTALASIVRGTVTRASDLSGVKGALVSAQVYDPTAADAKDRVVVRTSTASADDGGYEIFVAAGAYNVVAAKEDFAPAGAAVTTHEDETATQDFALAAADYGEVAGSASISGADDETFVTLSFRQAVTLGGADVWIEVASVNVANGGDYKVGLPAGDYAVVASTAGRTTQEAAVTVSAGATTAHDVAF